MDWSQDELRTLYANIYAGNWACPTCGRQLHLTPSREIGAKGTVRCRACDATHFVVTGNDPLHSSFRDYTAPEKAEMIAAHKTGESVTCPVDGTTIRDVGRHGQVIIQCDRCGFNAEYVSRGQ